MGNGSSNDEGEFDLAGYFDAFSYNLKGPIPIFVGRAEELCSCFLKDLEPHGQLQSFKLIIQAIGSLRASIILTQGGATGQVPALLRHCLEAGGYALLFEKDASWSDMWQNRHRDADAKNTFRRNHLAKIRNLLSDEDPNLKILFDQLYDELIDHGAHPNVLGVENAIMYEPIADNRYYVSFHHITGPNQRNETHYMLVQCAIFLVKIACIVWPGRARELSANEQCLQIWREAEAFAGSHGLNDG